MAKWKHAKLNNRRVTDIRDLPCKPKPYVRAFEFPKFLTTKEPLVHTNCLGNEEVALRNRFLKKTPDMSLNTDVLEQCYTELMHELKKTKIERMSVEDFLEGKKGKLGLRYQKAAQQLLDDGLDLVKDTKVSPFIKNEKYFEKKPPRLVYSRDFKFNVMYALYILPIEHAFTKLPQAAKGKNFMERGEAFARITGKWFAENDMSKFESTQRPELFHAIQKRMFKELYGGDDLIMQLFDAKMWKTGRTQKGMKWSAYGMMASGDMETGCFNSIFNWIACRYFEIMNGYGKQMFIVDGDDSVIQIPKGADPKNTFGDFGFDAKLFVKKDYHDVEFCSSKFIQIRPGVYYQVQNLEKLFNSIPYMINGQFNNSLADYYSSLGYMYRQLYCNIPVYSELARFLRTASNRYVNTKMLETIHYGAFQAFKKAERFFADPVLTMTELTMCFPYTIQELNCVINWLNNSKLDFPEEFSIPYKSRDRPIEQKVHVGALNAIRVVGKARSPPPEYKNLTTVQCSDGIYRILTS